MKSLCILMLLRLQLAEPDERAVISPAVSDPRGVRTHVVESTFQRGWVAEAVELLLDRRHRQ
jgi:hypothetical protein